MSAPDAAAPPASADGQEVAQPGAGADGENVVAATNPAQNRQPGQLESFFAVTKSLVIRALIIYFISSFFRNKSATPAAGPGSATDPTGVKTAAAAAAPPAWNFFDNGTVFDLHAYISEDYDSVKFHESSSLVWFQEGLVYGDWYGGPNGDGTYEHQLQITPTARVQNNGSLYLHVYVTREGRSPNPAAGSAFAGHELGHMRRLLNKFKKVKFTKTHNLLTGESAKSEEEQRKALLMSQEIVSHWHPNLTINVVCDQTNWVPGQVPAPFDEYITFHPNGNTYYPVVFGNDYWNMGRDYQPINATVEKLELRLTYQPLSMFKWQLYAAQSMKNKWTSNVWGEAFAGQEESDEDQDSLKETLLETNPYLLGMTIAISILHSVFELLAFKNDIQFWNNRKSLEGLSVRSVFFSVFQSVIVLLYVLDNETNIMIRLSCLVGLGIEVWKIQKVVDFRVDKERRWLGIVPRLTFSDKGSYAESATKEYDGLAFKYLSWICFPLLLAFGVYSVYYNEHKGWYSFVLNMLYGYLLTFGFIMMTPQLFINYKLKSVAHLPWRMMTYKFLNTFIDDIFAFVIKMPTLYRLGCFRDDIVFFIFLYQKWVYKVDHKRVNEFGFSGEMADEIAAGKQPLLPADSASTAGAIEAAADSPTTADSPAKRRPKSAKAKKAE